MQKNNSLEKTLMLGKIEGRRSRRWQRMRWLDGITDSMDEFEQALGVGWWTGKPGVLQSMGSHDWATELNWSTCKKLIHTAHKQEVSETGGPPGISKGRMRCCVLSLVVFNSSQSHGLQLVRHLCPWNFPGTNTGVGCHFLLQGIFLTQGLNLYLLHWQANSLPLCHLESPIVSIKK